MNGSFVLRKDATPNEWGELPVYLRYSVAGVAVKASVGVRINPKDWECDGDKTNRWVRNAHPRHTELNAKLLKTKRNVEAQIASFPDERAITIPIMRSILNGTYAEEVEVGKGKVSFIEHVMKHNEYLYKSGKIGYSVWENIKCNMRAFKKYLQSIGRETNDHNKLMCREINDSIIMGYISWRKERGNSNETINKALTPIFKTVGDCVLKGWIPREIHEGIIKLYLPKTSNLATVPTDDVQYLTKEQVRSLMNVAEKCKYTRTKEFMDMFLFSIHTCGLRFSDIATLKWDNIDLEKRILKKYLVKGHTRKNTLLTIPLSDESINILNRWKGRFDEFVFGLIPTGFDLNNFEELKKRLNSKNRCINTSLKCLGEKIKLPFPLHFHTARHTWATLSLNEGVDVKIISAMMGHSSVLVTEKTYSKFMPETLQMTMDERLNFVF